MNQFASNSRVFGAKHFATTVWVVSRHNGTKRRKLLSIVFGVGAAAFVHESTPAASKLVTPNGRTDVATKGLPLSTPVIHPPEFMRFGINITCMEEFRECADISEGSRYKHERTIIHLDLDCFYAQVEILKNPDLSTKPVGIKQQHYVITSNYIAREYGIKKCMLITEALALCPNLVIVNGEDLHDYRVMSSKVTEVIKTFSAKVEKLGLDENYVDVSKLVENEINLKDKIKMTKVVGHVYRNEIEINCTCGCKERLTVGSHIAEEIRNKIREVLGLTCCAGIAHNKLLAKLVCSTHKPNQQTTVFPSSSTSLVSHLNNVRAIPGIGRKTSDMLDALGVSSIIDLQNISLEKLEKHFGKTLAMWIKGACFGVDDSDVKESGKQQVIGLEEAAKTIGTMEDVQKRLSSLIDRGLVLLTEDGRHPTTLRVTVRKYSPSEEYSRQRETKQCPINISLFKSEAKEQIFEIALGLFKRIVDCSKPFCLTLIGLAFTKFQDEPPARSSLLKFMERKDAFQNKEPFAGTSEANKDNCKINKIKNDVIQVKSHTGTTNPSSTSHSNLEDIDRSVLNELPPDIRAEILQNYSECRSTPCTSSTSINTLQCPPGIEVSVFNELPYDIQVELIRESNKKDGSSTSFKKQKSILNYLSKK